MRFSSLLTVLFGGSNALLDASASDFNVFMTRGTRLFFNWKPVGSDLAIDWQARILDINTGTNAGKAKLKMKNNLPTMSVEKLKPHTKYEILLTAVRGDEEGETKSFTAWTSPRAVENVITVGRFASTVWIEWQPPSYIGDQGDPDQYVITSLDDKSQIFTSETGTQLTIGKGVSKQYAIQSVACDDCANPTNEAWSPLYKFTVTSLPPKPTGLEILEENIFDLERANVVVGWESPNLDYDSVKIEYSPNTPQGFTKSPSFLPNKWVTQATLEGLYQNVVYTISIRFVVNNVEGPSESISVAVSDNHGRFPQKQTCQVPTYLRPEALRVKRGIFGDPKMEVTWEHPRAKTPENGYRLVFAPFASISAGKPMIVDVDKNVKTFDFSGPRYDPYDEYTVSIFALHDEQLHAPASPDFVSSVFTGQLLANAGTNDRHMGAMSVAEEVKSDSCCGSKKYNSEVQGCCGGELYYLADPFAFCCGVRQSHIFIFT